MGENVKRFANDRNPNGLGYSNGVVEDEHGYYVLHSDYEALARQAEALERENAELREALKPFADVVGKAEQAAQHFGTCHVEDVADSRPYGSMGTTWGDLRRARALLGGSDAE